MTKVDDYSDDKGIPVERTSSATNHDSQSASVSQSTSSSSTMPYQQAVINRGSSGRNVSTQSSHVSHSVPQSVSQRRFDNITTSNEHHATNRDNFSNRMRSKYGSSSTSNNSDSDTPRSGKPKAYYKQDQSSMQNFLHDPMSLVWFLVIVFSIALIAWLFFGKSGVHISGNTGSNIRAAGRDLNE